MGKEVKTIAKDGSRRGIAKRGSKHRATLLLEQLQADAKAMFNLDDFDPVRMMSIAGIMASQGYQARNPQDGSLVVDENGDPIWVPPDLQLAVAAFAKVAPYVRSPLKPTDPPAETEGQREIDAVEKTRELLEALGADTSKLDFDAVREKEERDE